MIKIPTIYTTTDYNKFQTFSSNRTIMEDHVEKMMSSESFPVKFPTCPIVVDKDLCIIDGQHRFTAASRLGLPIYYIIDDDAKEEDMIDRNAKMRCWKVMDYVMFYSKTNDSYKFIYDLTLKYPSLSTSFHFCMVSNIAEKGKSKAFSHLKTGKMTLTEIDKKNIMEFYNVYVPFLKDFKAVRGRFALPYFHVAYIGAMVSIYKNDQKCFYKIIKKAPITTLPVPSFVLIDDAIQYLLKVSNWRPSRFTYDNAFTETNLD